MRAAGVSLAVLALLCLLCEVGFRVLAPAALLEPLHGLRRHLLTGLMNGWEARAYTVYQRPRDSVFGNSFGFNDTQWTGERTPGVPRIACLGGSTTEGGNSAGRKGSYPFLLEQVLEERTGRDFEVFNTGISGWTTNEMLVAWFLTIQDLQPDVVVLHEAVNDLEPRFRPDFRPDYSHWRVPLQTHPAKGIERLLVRSDLYLYFQMRGGHAPEILDVTTNPLRELEPLLSEGKLPRATSLPFRRNILSIVRSARADGREVVLLTLPPGPAIQGEFWRYGIAENNQHLRDICAEQGLRLADAERVFAARPELAAQFVDGVHVEPPGNRVKAELVADALADWTAKLSPDGARPPKTQE